LFSSRLQGGFNCSASLSLFSLLPILGRYTVSESLLFISNSTISTEIFVLPFSYWSTYHGTHSETHNFTILQLDPLSPSLLQTNITSFPTHDNLSLTALSLNGNIGLELPIDVYEGSVELGTNKGHTTGEFVSWVNSTAYPRSPNVMEIDEETQNKDRTGTNWAQGEVVWRGEGGKEVGIGKGEIKLMTEEGIAFLAAGTTWWGY